MGTKKHTGAHHELFNYMYNMYGVILTDSKMNDLIKTCNKTVENYSNVCDSNNEPSEKESSPLCGVSNSMLINWWYSDENGTEVTVKAIVDKWCIITDTMHDEPYNVELEFVQNMYKDSIDC